VDWVTLSISETARFTWEIPRDCSSEAAAISSTSCPIFREMSAFSLNASCVAVVSSLPLRTALIVLSIRLLVFFAASEARMAKFRTSSATTAKPAPASPARAASTAALRARRLVWKAISSMVLMILPVSSLERVISATAAAMSIICSLTFPTTIVASTVMALAWLALSALCLVMDDISSMEEEVSSREAACSAVPSARA